MEELKSDKVHRIGRDRIVATNDASGSLLDPVGLSKNRKKGSFFI